MSAEILARNGVYANTALALAGEIAAAMRRNNLLDEATIMHVKFLLDQAKRDVPQGDRDARAFLGELAKRFHKSD